MSGFWMVQFWNGWAIAIAIANARPFEIGPSKSPDFKCFQIWNGRISDPHCFYISSFVTATCFLSVSLFFTEGVGHFLQPCYGRTYYCKLWDIIDVQSRRASRLKSMYSGGSNSDHSKSESIRKPNVLKVGLNRPFYHPKTERKIA